MARKEWEKPFWQYRIRRMLAEDLPDVVAMWLQLQPFPASLEKVLPEVLANLIQQQFITGAMVERLRGPETNWELAAFGFGSFMAPRLRERYLREPFGFVAVDVLEHARAGKIEEVLLSRQEVDLLQRKPPPRLDYLVLTWLQDNFDFTDEDGRQLLLQGVRVLERYATGFRLRSLLLEGMVHNLLAFRLAGFSRVVDCSDMIPPQYAELKDDPRYRPFMHGMHELGQGMADLPLNPIARLFHFTEPVLDLTDSQKEVLDLALEGYSDQAIARFLSIKPSAVQMRWRRIYEKALLVLPELAEVDERCADGRRGQEKRRMVVEYIREHPQEIRPWIVMPR